MVAVVSGLLQLLVVCNNLQGEPFLWGGMQNIWGMCWSIVMFVSSAGQSIERKFSFHTGKVKRVFVVWWFCRCYFCSVRVVPKAGIVSSFCGV